MDKLLKKGTAKQDLQVDYMAKLSQKLQNSEKIKESDLQNQVGVKPKTYYCRHMEIGVAGYEDETIFIGLEALKKMMPSFEGCPLYVYHVDNVDYDDIRSKADGYVTDCFYNEKDGWIWAKFIAVTAEAQKKVAEGWSVSNAYIPKEWGGGGTWHNVPYNRSISDGEFTHLAIVPNPRYEDAKIFSLDEFKKYQEELTNELKQLHNSKQGAKKMFKLFKNTREEVTSIDEDTMVELEDGTSVKFSEMKNAVLENSKKEKENEDEKEKMNMNTIVEVGEEKMPLKELVNKYKNMCKEDEKANESKEEDEKANKSEEDEKENSEEDEKENSEEEEKKNALEKEEKQKKFNELKNAHKTSGLKVELATNKIKRGNERYGSGK